MIYDILEAKIIAAGLGVAGVSLFRNTMPADVKMGVMIRGPLTGIKTDQHLPGYYKPIIQVIVRHADPVLGTLMADQVIAALLVQGQESHAATAEHGASTISLFYPRDLPIQFPRMDGNVIEWSINFDAVFTFKATWQA